MEPLLTPDYVSTTQVAEALGISVSTVKRWVESGILPAQKTAGGHRKLLLADVLELARQSNLPVRDPALLNAGRRNRRVLDPPELEENLYGSLVAGDANTVRSLLHGAYGSGMPVETMADSVIAPAMHRVGHEWETGRIGVMHEHRASQLCAGALYELKAVLEARANRRRPVAVGGALEKDFSELPTLLAQMVLLDAGWTAVNLGPNTPLVSLGHAVAELQPRLVWLSISHLLDEKLLTRDYLQLYQQAERAGVAVVVGGRALVESRRATIPYTAYGDALSHLAAFARTLHPRARRPRRGRPPQ
jgi:MerR family transcriptional regulator, light-induced transcriptional regulator